MAGYNTKQFLIVDDFADFRSALISMLRQLGARDIDAVSNGEDALALCRKKHYDIILHDYNLGRGKNGQQVLEALHHERLLKPDCVFVLISADSSQAMVMAALECEPDSYLAKPFNLVSLQRRLDQLVAMKTALLPILEAQHEGNYTVMLSCCKQILASHPRYRSQCQRYMVIALAGLQQHQAQEQLLHKVIREQPTAWALQALADLYRETGRLSEAQQTYEEGIRQFPMMPALYDGLAATALALGDPLEAQQQLQQGLSVSPNSLRRQQSMGDLARRNKDHEQAVRAYRQAVELGRNSVFRNPENNLNLVSSLQAEAGDSTPSQRMLGEVRQVLTELDRSYKDDPALLVRSRLAQAQTLHMAGQTQDAKRLAAQAAEHVAEAAGLFSIEAALRVAEQLRELEQSEQADTVLGTCAEMYGDDPDVMEQLASMTDNPAILLAGSDALEWNQQGILAYQQREYPQALTLFRQALAAQPRNISFALNTAQSLLRLMAGQADASLLDECRYCLHQASHMQPNDHRRERYLKLCNRLEKM